MRCYNSKLDFPRLLHFLLLFPLHFTSCGLHNLQLIWNNVCQNKGKTSKHPSLHGHLFLPVKPLIQWYFLHIHPTRFILGTKKKEKKKITSQKSYHLVSLWKCTATRATIHTASIKASTGIPMKLKGRNISPGDETNTNNKTLTNKPTTKSYYVFLLLLLLTCFSLVIVFQMCCGFKCNRTRGPFLPFWGKGNKNNLFQIRRDSKFTNVKRTSENNKKGLQLITQMEKRKEGYDYAAAAHCAAGIWKPPYLRHTESQIT